MSVLAGVKRLIPGAALSRDTVERMLRAMAPLSAAEESSRMDLCSLPDESAIIGRLAYGPTDQGPPGDDTSDVKALVAGEFFDADGPPSESADAYLRSRYLQHDESFAEGLNGSFAAAVLDGRTSILHLLTDHCATRSLFTTVVADVFYFASEVKGLLAVPGISNDPDARSVLFLLCQAFYLNGRSLIDKVHQLDYGTRMAIAPRGIERRRYWEFAMEPDESRSVETLTKRLTELMPPAVARRCRGDNVALLLSGGIDSRGLLPCIPNDARVTVCSYSADSGSADWKLSDACIARRLAQGRGLPFQLFNYQTENVLDAIQQSVYASDGAAWFVFEDFAGVWDPIRTELGARFYLAGDQCFGVAETAVRQDGIAGMIGAHSLLDHPSLQPLIRQDRLNEFMRITAEDVEETLSALRATDSEDQLDELHFVERVVHLLNPKRQIVTRRGLYTRIPWFDLDVMNFVRTMPKKCRRRRSLFHRAASRLDPESFRLPRARAAQSVSYLPVLRRLEETCGAVSAFIFDENPWLDEFFDVPRLRGAVQKWLAAPAPARSRSRPITWRRLLPVGTRKWLQGVRARIMPKQEVRVRGDWYLLSVMTVACALRYASRRFESPALSK